MITLLHPSRSRPQKAWETANHWLDKAGVHCQYLISLDEDDPKLDDYKALFDEHYPLFIYPNTCVVEAANAVAKVATGNILVYLSDDFKCPDNWGQLVLEQFKDVTTPLLIKVDDGYQLFGKDVLTIPIMNRVLYEKLGYFFHPEYRSMFVDQHLYHTVNNMGAIRFCPHLLFPHEHYCNGKAKIDDTYKRSNMNWDSGKALYAKHKAEGFPPYQKV